MTVEAFTPASSFGGIDVSANGLAQHLAKDTGFGRSCSLITSSINVPDDRVNLIRIYGVFVGNGGGGGGYWQESGVAERMVSVRPCKKKRVVADSYLIRTKMVFKKKQYQHGV